MKKWTEILSGAKEVRPAPSSDEVKAILLEALNAADAKSPQKISFYEELVRHAQKNLDGGINAETRFVAEKVTEKAINHMATYYSYAPQEWASVLTDGNFVLTSRFMKRMKGVVNGLGVSLLSPSEAPPDLSDAQIADRVAILKAQLDNPDRYGPYDQFKEQVRKSDLYEAHGMMMSDNAVRQVVDSALATFVSRYSDDDWRGVVWGLKNDTEREFHVIPTIERTLRAEIETATHNKRVENHPERGAKLKAAFQANGEPPFYDELKSIVDKALNGKGLYTRAPRLEKMVDEALGNYAVTLDDSEWRGITQRKLNSESDRSMLVSDIMPYLTEQIIKEIRNNTARKSTGEQLQL